MQLVGYYFALPFLYLISLLPSPLFYLLSDGLYFLVYHVIGYRKKVVYTNLKNAFPEKSEAEIESITKEFYHYLLDITLETFKTLTFSKNRALKHAYMSDLALALFEKYRLQNQNVIIVMGHYGNWEWSGNAFSLMCKQKLFVIYHPLTNPYFDRLVMKMRKRFGTGLIAMNDTFREMIRNRNEVNATAFIADQTPSSGENAYWTTFLNQETPVFWGTELIAKKMNVPVVYVCINRKKRGVYEVNAETLIENPKDSKEGEISELHTRRLEKDIVKNPAYWLWSHRRWKHNRK